MKSSSSVVIATLIFGSGQVAFARDHQELVCSAVAKPKDNGDRIPLFIHFFENRSSDGQSRDETLSTVYQGKLFQAQRVNSTGDFSKDAPIVLKAGTAIRFRGKYSVESTSSGYVIKLNGEVNDDPSDSKATFRTASATLTCADLSI